MTSGRASAGKRPVPPVWIRNVFEQTPMVHTTQQHSRILPTKIQGAMRTTDRRLPERVAAKRSPNHFARPFPLLLPGPCISFPRKSMRNRTPPVPGTKDGDLRTLDLQQILIWQTESIFFELGFHLIGPAEPLSAASPSSFLFSPFLVFFFFSTLFSLLLLLCFYCLVYCFYCLVECFGMFLWVCVDCLV